LVFLLLFQSCCLPLSCVVVLVSRGYLSVISSLWSRFSCRPPSPIISQCSPPLLFIGKDTGTPADRISTHRTHTCIYRTHTNTVPMGTGFYRGVCPSTTVYVYHGTPHHGTDTTGYTHHVWPHIPLVTPWIASTFQTSSNCSALCRRGFHVGYSSMLGVMHSAAWLGVYGVDVSVG
jgi:hypothetical protein